ncbi:MAG: shikimate dehydrogenase [Alphaproteobacteria bacterium]|nr:shikimate dehydrogenase [Alphaproteobacteria bacterium]
MKAGVIGWPISHSKSPLIHGYWLEKFGLSATYEAIAIAPENLKADIERLVKAGYCGFNVTVPHKQAIMPLLDYIRADAERIGAVNTVVINPDGTLEGRNTDAFGFIENLREGAPKHDFKKAPAVVLGAGGAARAVVYALAEAGAPQIRIANRTLVRARELASAFKNCVAVDWEALPEAMEGAGLLVNTTSLGMKGQPPLEVTLNTLPLSALVHDIVYAPLQTELLQSAKQRGHTTVTGIGMLLHQARPAFHAWFGVMPDVDEALRAKVLAA